MVAVSDSIGAVHRLRRKLSITAPAVFDGTIDLNAVKADLRGINITRELM